MKAPFLRTMYNYDMNKASDESGINCSVDLATGEYLPTMAQQSFQEECDINCIVKRFGIGHQLPEGGVAMPTYGDFTGVNDFQSALNAVVSSRESFEQLSAEVRARFHNDPQELLEFCGYEHNRAEAERLGLAVPRPEPEPVPPAPVPPAPGPIVT